MEFFSSAIGLTHTIFAVAAMISGGVVVSFNKGTTTHKNVGYIFYCRECGSLLFSSVRNHQYAHVTYGTLSNTPSLRPTVHICVDSKADWYEILDDLPQFGGLPG